MADFSKEVETDDGRVRFKGATDLCLVNRQSEPVLPTDVKTKEEVDYLDGPNRHHRAQVHAYMRGLSEKHDCDVDEAVVIYGSRKTLNVRTFVVEFDDEFWQEVVAWAADHSESWERGELPAAEPEYDWECKSCDYRHRCGQSDEPYHDVGPTEFLPHFDAYPRERVVEYLRADETTRPTPTLAPAYPDLAEQHGVRSWSCHDCGRCFEGDAVEPPAETTDSPSCPRCAEEGTLATLHSPLSVDED